MIKGAKPSLFPKSRDTQGFFKQPPFPMKKKSTFLASSSAFFFSSTWCSRGTRADEEDDNINKS